MRPAISSVDVLHLSGLPETRRLDDSLLWCCYRPDFSGLLMASPIPAVGRVAPLADHPALPPN
jgi:hypothetical protein